MRGRFPLSSSGGGEGWGEEGGLKAEARRPRAERRPSSEIRRPKPEAAGGSGFGLLSAFDLRPSDFRLPLAGWPSHPPCCAGGTCGFSPRLEVVGSSCVA